MVELNPAVDRDGQTGRLAALTVWWLLRGRAERGLMLLAHLSVAMHCCDNSQNEFPKNVGGAMALRVCGTFLSLLLLSVQVAAAQVRQISGRVTNSQTEQGLAGATVAVTRHRIVAETNNDGNYTLNAPDGDQNLVVRAIGFKRQQVTVPRGQTTADVALDPDVFKLEEIVITGQATGVERQNLPNAVATVSGERAEPGPGPDRRERAPGQDPRRLHPGQLRRAGWRHPAQPARRVHHHRQRGPALRGGRHRGQQRRDPQRRRTR